MMNERQEKMLRAIAARPCVTIGPCDVIDEDYLALVRDAFVSEYWGTGGFHAAATDRGRERIALSDQPST